MKTPEEVIDSYLCERYENYKTGNPIGEIDVEDCIDMMKEYAKEAIRYLVEYGDSMKILKSWYHPETGMHGTATDEDNLQKFLNKL